MSFTLKLDPFTHDITIDSTGHVPRIAGADAVRQKVKVALQHYEKEYFLNVPNGVPWYDELLGLKGGSVALSNVIRKKILDTPGVIRIAEFNLIYDTVAREYTPRARIVVEKGVFDENDLLTLDGIFIKA